MKNIYRIRRAATMGIALIILLVFLLMSSSQENQTIPESPNDNNSNKNGVLAINELQKLPIKGRAPKTDYSREQFGSGWTTMGGCDTRNIILHRDLNASVVDENCNVTRGTLHDPYTGKTIEFVRGVSTSADVQIDHVVALSDAWQKGAQLLTREKRIELANDPLELLAVDGAANQQKLDGDAATWLPSNKPFRCQYIARQIAVKSKYLLWITDSEKRAIINVLTSCPTQTLPSE